MGLNCQENLSSRACPSTCHQVSHVRTFSLLHPLALLVVAVVFSVEANRDSEKLSHFLSVTQLLCC